MLYKHPFHEGVLATVGRAASESDSDLADMEGAFVYEAAQTFLPSSQIHCIKVITDNLDPESVTKEGLEKAMSETAGEIYGWLDSITEKNMPAGIFTGGENSLMELISEHLRLSFAMRQKLRQECRQAKIRGLDITAILSGYAETAVKDKKERKDVFTELTSVLYEGSATV